VLSHVVALLDPVEGLVGAYQGIGFLVLGKRPDHLELFERERLERLLAPVQVGRDAAPGAFLRRRELARLERVGEIESLIREGLERLYGRQRVDTARDALVRIAHELPELVDLGAAAG